MKLRTVRAMYYLLFAAAFFIVVAGYGWPLWIYCAACVAVLLAMMLLLLQNFWRCPLCGQPLGRMKMGAVVECPHCRKRISI